MGIVKTLMFCAEGVEVKFSRGEGEESEVEERERGEEST